MSVRSESAQPMADLVELREVSADDDHVLDAVFAGMSVDSRYLRYLTAMPTLPTAARRLLNAVDGRGHVAVAAYVGGQPIGLARIISQGGGRAELALEVVDAYQGQGVGTLLARWMRDRAAALGYSTLVAETSAANAAAMGLTRKVFPEHTSRREGTVTVVELAVGSVRHAA